MAQWKTKLLDRTEVAVGTMQFNLEKPQGFDYKGGQHITLRLTNPPQTDEEGNSRIFSLVSAPFEPNLTVTTRMRETAFKNSLKIVPLYSEMDIDGPSGNMTLHSDTQKPAVMIAGGIGITPFISMVKQATHNKLLHKIYLFYSNRKPVDAAYLNQLKSLEKENTNFKLIATMTQIEGQAEWTGETGYVNKEMLSKYLSDLITPIYYMAGPPPMVEAMQKLLEEISVSPDNIKFENFTGY